MPKLSKYVLITPARNEAQFIEFTIKSVISQTVQPLKWVIVSDGSTDGTDDIVSKYASTNPWIELVRMPERRERHFAGKVHAFNAGYAKVKNLEYEVIGSLDGDVSFDQDYFSFLLEKLAGDLSLGVVGTSIRRGSRLIYNYYLFDTRHVSGPCQLFRRKCFEEVGGYVPSKKGGVDVIAVTSARMKGWKTITFTERTLQMYREMGMADGGRTRAQFDQGVKDSVIGNDPIWEIGRAIYQMSQRPFVIGGLMLGAGYVWALIRGIEKAAPPELVTFRKLEQKQRLWNFLTGSSISSDQTLQYPSGVASLIKEPVLDLPPYVLVTPARNEAQFIEFTIKSVISQTVQPLKWVIVSDGSTDGTDDIVSKYASANPWIELVRMPERRERHFAGKVHAFNAGYAKVKNLEYEVIGSLDADVSFDQDYFSFLLEKLAEDLSLGLVGTPFADSSLASYEYRFAGIEHVCGACQLFRRTCFEEIGGYVPMKRGGIDLVACITARMRGWKTQTFTDRVCQHHRGLGMAGSNPYATRFKYGIKDYVLGGHPLWEMLRVFYQMAKRPYLGGIFLGAGYLWAIVRRMERPVSREFVAFRKREQLRRLRRLAKSIMLPSSEAVQQPSRSA